MHLQFFVSWFFILFFSVDAFSKDLNVMGCEWSVPGGFSEQGKNLWASQSDSMSLIYFENDFFKKEVIDTSINPSVRQQKSIFSEVDNGYRVTVYVEYLVRNDEVIFPSWVTIEHESRKGVFYLQGLQLDEIVSFVSPCMPNLNLVESLDDELQSVLAPRE